MGMQRPLDRAREARPGTAPPDERLVLLRALGEAQRRTSRLVADYEARIAGLTAELERLRAHAVSHS